MKIFKTFGKISSLDSDKVRKQKLLDIIIKFNIALGLFVLIFIIIPDSFVDSEYVDFKFRLYLSIFGFLFFSAVIYILNRYRHVEVAGRLLVLILVLAFGFSDSPENVGGRTLNLFVIPIILSGFILSPRMVFITTGVVSSLIVFIALTAGLIPNIIGIIGLILVAFITWLSSNTMERALADLRLLVQDLDARVEERTEELKKTQQHLIKTAHKAGMAEIAVGILHNIGNTLNSVNISTREIIRIIGSSRIRGFSKANKMLSENRENLADFLVNDTRGKLLPDYYMKLGKCLQNEQNDIDREAELLLKNIRLIKEVIDTQQEYAKVESYTEEINVFDAIEEALIIQHNMLQKYGVEVSRSYSENDNITLSVQKSKLIHILLNIFKNACEALKESGEKHLEIDVIKSGEGEVAIKIFNSGKRIEKEVLDRIFNYGFTTKKDGHGFGLHVCANFMAEMGGKIQAENRRHGTVFTLFFSAV